jgi:CheY-like chemotaxis protein
LRQVLANLLSNAIKFTARGEIVLHVRRQELTDDAVTLEFAVADTGIGIPQDKQRVIFEEFVQADASTTRQYGGTGLGLAIASRLAGVLGGSIGLESEPNRGSTFHFTARFGLGAAGAVETPRDRDPIVALRPLRVLLVEDSVANQRVATGMLEKMKHTVRVVIDGAAAVEACAAERFDVVLMDLQMPRMDGYEATRAIRRREQEQGAPRTPIVALTARASMGNEALCLSAGFDGYLPKPYRSRELLDAISAQVEGTEQAVAPAAPAGFSAPAARLDWDAALEAVDGDRELLGKVLDGFLGQQPALIAEIREALETGDLPVVKRVAHTVGGSLRLFQGARVVALANDLEDRCEAGSSDQVAASWSTLEPELAAVVVELREWVRNQA